MDATEVVGLIQKYGFPVVAAVAMGGFVFYVWRWATEEIDPVLSEANKVLVALIDRVRMLDNDLIRLNQKLNVVLELKRRRIEDLEDNSGNADPTWWSGASKTKNERRS